MNVDQGRFRPLLKDTSRRAFRAILLLTGIVATAAAKAHTYSYVSAGSGAKMWMINMATSKVVASIPSEGPAQQVLSADGKLLYVAHSERDEVSVIDYATKRERACVRVGKGPYGVTLSIDGTRLFVWNMKSKSVSVIDTKIDKVIETDPTPNDNFGMRMAPDGRMSKVK